MESVRGVLLPRPKKIKNKSPAAVQITAEQLIADARCFYLGDGIGKAVAVKIDDAAELAEYQSRRRIQFEKRLRRGAGVGVWVEYAQWEASQGAYDRARSVFERGVSAHRYDYNILLRYAMFEMKNRFVNRACNIWDRAVTLFPKINQIWLKYVHLLEAIGNFGEGRQVYERWMEWVPAQEAWLSYVSFELRYGEIDRARAIYERYVRCCCNSSSAWISYAQFERKMGGGIAKARVCFEKASVELSSSEEDGSELQKLLLAFAEFEEDCGEIERARCIYAFAHKKLKSPGMDFSDKVVQFERRCGEVEELIPQKRRTQYEDAVKKNPLDYDSWFDLIALEESLGDKGRIREAYERAISNIPPAAEKPYWLRYIYLWVNYALYEELDAQNIGRARQVYQRCLNVIPHHKFSFAKIWWLAAELEIRQLDIRAARRFLGNAIGRAPKCKIFKKYMELELQLGNMDRCRKIYEKFRLLGLKNFSLIN